MKGLRFTSLLSILLAAVLVLAACGSSNSNKNNSASAPSAAPSESAVTSSASAGKKTVAVLLFTRKFEFMVGLEVGAKQIAEELGIDVVVLDGNTDSQTQIGQIEDQIAKKVDAIVLAPNNSDELVPGVKKANQANIPVVTLDGIVTPGEVEIYGEVRFDNYSGGRAAAEFVASQLSGGKVLELTGPLGHQHARERHRGMVETLTAVEGFTVNTKDVEFDTNRAQSTAAAVLTAEPDTVAIVSETDGMNPGVISALKQVNMMKKVGEDGHILIVGVDGTPDALEMIRQGDIDATIQQDPIEMGRIAVQLAVDAIEGKPAPTEAVLLQPSLVTIDNVDDPKNWGNNMGK